MIIGTLSFPTVENIVGSCVPPDTSFTISAPASMAAFATTACRVSMDIGTSETRFRV